MNEDDKGFTIVHVGCLTHVVSFILGVLLAALLFTSCASPRVVKVPEVHDVHHYHTDSIYERDSIFTDRQTTIMQLDSAQMAQYGIRLSNAERAWLVLTKELEYRLRQLAEQQRDSIHRRDSIPVPYPVEKKVPAELSWWQQLQLWLGRLVLVLLNVVAITFIIRLWIRMKFGRE